MNLDKIAYDTCRRLFNEVTRVKYTAALHHTERRTNRFDSESHIFNTG